MTTFQQSYYDKRAQILIKKLRSRKFDAWYCPDRQSALEKVLELIPAGASVGWGGCTTAEEIGLTDVLRNGEYQTIDRDQAKSPEERVSLMKRALLADVFITSANAISLDGQMVNIDGNGNRVAAIVYGPDSVIVVAGMNKVVDSLEEAVARARKLAAPINKQRFPEPPAPCSETGSCADCISNGCICSQVLLTRYCKPAGRIKFVLVGETLGF